MWKIFFRRDILQIIVDWIVSNVEHVLIRATPILSPLPSAFAITHALDRADWDHPVLIGGIIEGLGMVAGAFMGALAIHNREHPTRSIYKKLGYILFGFYVALAVGIIGGSETLPAILQWRNGGITSDMLARSVVPLLFPGLTLIGSVIVALREYMRRADEEAKHEQERTEANQDTNQRRQDAEFELSLEIKRQDAAQRLTLQQAEHAQRLQLERQKVETNLETKRLTVVRKQTANKPEITPATPVDDSVLVNKLLEVYGVNPRTSLRKAGFAVGLSHTGVSKMLDRLESAGTIHRNGDGVKIHINGNGGAS